MPKTLENAFFGTQYHAIKIGTCAERYFKIVKVLNSRAMFAKIKKDPILCGAFGECVHSYIERGVVIKWDSSWVNCPPSILLPALFHFTTSNY